MPLLTSAGEVGASGFTGNLNLPETQLTVIRTRETLSIPSQQEWAKSKLF